MPESPSSEQASSDFNTPETPGPYFIAFVDEGEAFEPSVHAREDDDIFEFTLEHQEGNFASLALTIKNPRIGLLAPGRKIWAWFSWDNGSTVIPLFKGRLVGLPDSLADETVVLNFLARPSDFIAQQQAAADALKVQPYWDSIWFAPVSPDDQSAATTTQEASDVLESRPELWFIDPVTHVVSTSNTVNGEDGMLDFDEDAIFYDSVKVTYATNPLRSVQMTATVSWDQIGSGSIVPPVLRDHGTIVSYTGDGLAKGWPKDNASVGGGWSWAAADVTTTGSIDSSLIGEIAFTGAIGPGGTSSYLDGGFDTGLGTWGTQADGTNIGWSYHVAIPNVTVNYSQLTLLWAANRRKTEVLTFTLNADVQDIVTLPDDGATLKLSLSSSELNGPIDPDGAIPLGSQTARSYFTTERGAQSIEYLLAICRANLIARARCVNITFEIPFELGVSSALSLRKNATIHDSRLPGTTVNGKITDWSLSLGADGLQHASITIGVCVGLEGSVTATNGTPDYCSVDYVDGFVAEQASSDAVSESPSDELNEERYQTYSGRNVLPFASDISYESILGQECNDDGIDLDRITSRTVQLRILNGNGDGETQQDALSRFAITVDNTGKVTAVNTRFAQIQLTVPDLTGGPFETDYFLNVSTLKIPKGIDLSAESEGASSS